MKYHIGLDIGSTTIKAVVMNESIELVFSIYERHYSDIKNTLQKIISNIYNHIGNVYVTIALSGSGALTLKDVLQIDFIQEVSALVCAIEKYLPDADVAIEIGGEDSKITYLKGNMEQRMNSICAGGTGAFIDQMASLLKTDVSGLNNMASDYEKIYPIASRCGVFAKTDIQALMNQGAKNEDIAISIFQSVVNQTISNLACGRPISGKVAFLGGPLYYIPALKQRFVETLELSPDNILSPSDAQLFVAKGAALNSVSQSPIPFKEILDKISVLDSNKESNTPHFLKPLFKTKNEYENFVFSHKSKEIKYGDLKTYKGRSYLGIDAGSTTTKIVLMSENYEILYSFYGNNYGKPLEIVVEKLQDIYRNKNKDLIIEYSGVTGYGEDFLRAALKIDIGEVETIAHFRAAKYFNKDVSYIIDIGGQDMKAISIKDGLINSIQLNEACSSGCGSFLETFAKSLNLTIQEFSDLAMSSQKPVDLGSRCTVFMNSKVKQAQKEGNSVADIAAGLSYSVVKNALQKVIKIKNFDDMGDNIVVQGGTFLNNGILRVFEIITNKKATRPEISGLMGAFGMAILAKENSRGFSKIKVSDELYDFKYEVKRARCTLCTNNCSLNINIFRDGSRFITGNRCEKGSGKTRQHDELPNMYKYKNERLFHYVSLNDEDAIRGSVGIPRVLNMYENYPFWHTLLTELKFKVVLSGTSNRKMYEKGLASITSETLCYPAKLVHGHIVDLISRDVDMIFYPSVFYEEKQFNRADNTINCPVVAGYPDVIKNNMEIPIKFLHPFVSFENRDKMREQICHIFKEYGVGAEECREATERAYAELDQYRYDIYIKGKQIIKYTKEKSIPTVVLAGRPYHVDPEINHGIPELLNSLGIAVITEDAISYGEEIDGRLRVLDQWTYHSRLYRAAKIVGESENLELIQLNSFGCGLDSVTTDQVNEILKAYHKIYTVLKIDEISNLGAIKIRVRSLIQAIENRSDKKIEIPELEKIYKAPKNFTVEMRDKHTILMPQMAPLHFKILKQGLISEGYNMEILTEISDETVNCGLKYVNNDACYPAIIVVGQFVQALQSGKYDLDNVSLLMTQTGGACRASNYIGFIRKALEDAGFSDIPVIALSFQGIEKNSGFSLSFSLANKALLSILYGDLLMRLSNATRPYEITKGATDQLTESWVNKLSDDIFNNKLYNFNKNVNLIIKDYKKIEQDGIKRVKVGMVGEILVKFLPEANNFMQQQLESEDVEVVVPDLMDFLLYGFENSNIKYTLYGKNKLSSISSTFVINIIEHFRQYIRNALKQNGFSYPYHINQLRDYAKEFVSLGHQYGEGWLLTAEMIELIHSGVPNIVCVQPFACLPNHLTGKGVIKAIRSKYPEANIVPLDYDPGASEVNQTNRMKLMLSQAKKNLEFENKEHLKELGKTKTSDKRFMGRIKRTS